MKLTHQFKVILFVAILFSCIGCDQFTKHLASEHLKGQGTFSFLGDTIRLQYMENPGAFLGLGGTLSPTIRFWLFTVMNVVVLVVVLWVGKDYWLLNGLTLSLGALFLAGGIGNTIDRIQYDGVVIDFLNVGIGWLRTGVFNVADMAITFSVIMLLTHGYKTIAPPSSSSHS